MQQNRQEKREAEQPEQGDTSHITSVSPQQEEQSLIPEQQQVEECMDMLRRTQADFVNYRRRVNQEQAEGRIAAQSALLSHLLPVLDDLRRALEAAPAELNAHPWVQGLFLVARRLTTQLEQVGVREIGTPGERFDPHVHEAITTQTQPDVPEGTVLHVIQPGYALGERIIRPAQVSVARASSSVEETSGRQESSQ
jgi:molecular chaperone GrpE